MFFHLRFAVSSRSAKQWAVTTLSAKQWAVTTLSAKQSKGAGDFFREFILKKEYIVGSS